jgi:IS605 OrfB family transposase
VFRKHDAQKRFYTELRKRFGLAAQPAIRVIGKVADAYAALRANLAAGNYGPPGSDRRRRIEESPIVFRSSAAQPFDARCLSWQFPDDMGRAATISIWTVTGRLKSLRIMGNPNQLNLLLVNIATTSTGQKASGGHLNSYRKRQAQLRQRLQAKKTSSATAAAVKRRRKEARFAADVNHQISKRIVAEAQRTGRGIAVEELSGIRDRVRLRKPQRAALHSWAFAQLGSFLAYKAKLSGVAFVEVDPAYTPQTCSACGWVRQEKPPLPNGIRMWPVWLRWARRPQRSDQHRHPRCRTLGRSHASTRSAHPDSQLGRQQQA